MIGRPRNYTDTKCLNCSAIFYRRTHGHSRKPQYCTRNCYFQSGKVGNFRQGHKLNIGRKQSEETIIKKRKMLMGHPVSSVTRQKISESLQGNTPWNKGIKSQSSTRKIKNCWRGRLWAKQIRMRDKACVLCGSTERLEADHIKPVYLYPELAYDLSNGRALCRDCHKETDTYGGRVYVQSI